MSGLPSADFSSIKCNSILINESNDDSVDINSETAVNGFYIAPSQVLGRSDITGYVLSSQDNEGKVEWVSTGSFVNGRNPKDSVRAASTGNVTEPVTIIDDVVLNDNDRILLKDQVDLSENGIYTVDGGLLTRSGDAETGFQSTGAYTIALEGTANFSTLWVSPEDNSVFGDAITFEILRTTGAVALPAPLQSIADLVTIPNQMLYTTAPNTYDTTSLAVVGRSFLGESTTALQRSALGLEIGVDVQAFASQLSDLVTIAGTANQLAYTVGGSYSGTSVTAFIRGNVLNAPDAATLALNLGYITQAAPFVATNMVRTSGATEVEETGITIDNSDNITGVGSLTATGNINGVTPTEMAQLANINAVTISNTQWGFLGALDQGLATTDTPTFTGLSAGSQKITSVLSPTNALDAANKTYVDTVAATGASPLVSADYATAAILPDTPVYASPAETLTSVGGPGTLSVDGQVVIVGNRLLIKDQADNRENGVYDVTDDGATPGPNWVLTRSNDFNQAAMPEAAGTSIFVEIVAGASNSASTFALQFTVNDVDPLTDPVVWVQTGGSATLTAGLGIDAAQLGGGTIQIDNTARFTFSGNELELATVTVPFGGTGNTTLDANGVLVGDGVNAVDTSKPAPTGDFVGTTDVQALTNKTITDNTNDVTARSLFSNSGTNSVSVFAAANPTAGQVLTATNATTATWQDATGGVTTFARTLTVSPSNPDVSPNWTTLDAAITDAITLTPTEAAQVLIIMYPGDYAESTPLSVPSWVTISGQVSAQNVVIIRPTAPAPVGAILTSDGNVRLYGLVLDGDDGAGGNSTIGFSSVIGTVSSQDVVSSVTTRNCSTAGFLCVGNGTQFSRILIVNNCSSLVTQGAPFVMTSGYEIRSGGIISGNVLFCSGFLSGGGVMTNGILCINDFSYGDFKSLSLSSVTVGIRVGSGVTSNNINDYPIVRLFSGVCAFYSSTAYFADTKSNILFFDFVIENNRGIFPAQTPFTSVNPTLPADPNKFIVLDTYGGFNSQVSFSGDLTNPPEVILTSFDVAPGLSEYQIVMPSQAFGNFVQPCTTHLGQGGSHTSGMVVIREDGGVPTFITTELSLVTVNPFQCDLASTAAIDLASAPATIDGVAPTIGVTRVLVKNGSTVNPGTTSVDNGIYVWNGVGVAMTRAADFLAAAVFYYETYFAVDVGTVNYGSRWQIDASTFAGDRITVGTTAWGVIAFSAQLLPASPAIGDALYIGSATVIAFPGIEIRITANLTTSSGTSVTALVWEYWNGGAWVTQPLMSTTRAPPDIVYANETMSFGVTPTAFSTIGYNYRFGDISGWVPTTVQGVFGYWVRSRVINSAIITQVPVGELIRLHTNRTTIGPQGFNQYFGAARPRKSMSFMTTRGNNTSFTLPGNQALVAADDGSITIQQTFVNCNYVNGGVRGLGWTFVMAPETDTSFPLLLKLYVIQRNAGVGNVALKVDYVQTLTGSLISPGGVPTTTLFTTGYVAKAVPGVAGAQNIATFELPITTFLAENRLFWFQISRDGPNVLDTYEDNIFIPVVEVTYRCWCDGKYVA